MTAAPRFRRYDPETRARMLVEAGLACLAEGGITAFTIDNICEKAQASRGLVSHHFGSKDGLLAAVYAAAYAPTFAAIAPADADLPLGALIDRVFSAEKFTPGNLNIWLAIWGETPSNPRLLDEHRRQYAAYRATIAAAIARHAVARGREVDADTLAAAVIALADGYWLEQCLDPDRIAPDAARAACVALLDPLIGPLSPPDPTP
jgi:TetR/AcrR family transcriptional regulator, transcriptional repressor of bet genes